MGKTGTVDVRMLRPASDKRTVEILSGDAANSAFGHVFTPPKPDRPEANGHRVMFSPSRTSQCGRIPDRDAHVGRRGRQTPHWPWRNGRRRSFLPSVIGRSFSAGRGMRSKSRFRSRFEEPGSGQLILTGLGPGSGILKRKAGTPVPLLTFRRIRTRHSSCCPRETTPLRPGAASAHRRIPWRPMGCEQAARWSCPG